MDSKIFEELKRINEYNSEFWYARDIQKTLEYTKWSNFLKVIEKAKESCQNSNIGIDDNFCEIARTIEIGNNAIREIDDIMLSRYAYYLIVMNGDPRKEVIALGQT